MNNIFFRKRIDSFVSSPEMFFVLVPMFPSRNGSLFTTRKFDWIYSTRMVIVNIILYIYIYEVSSVFLPFWKCSNFQSFLYKRLLSNAQKSEKKLQFGEVRGSTDFHYFLRECFKMQDC